MGRPKKIIDEIEEKSNLMNSIYSDLVKEGNAFIPDSSSILGEEDVDTDAIQFIPSHSYILDTLISNRMDKGGYPLGRCTEISGDPSSGKSLLGIHAMYETQKLNGICIYLDIEKAMSLSFMKKMGVDISNIHYTRKLITIEQVIDYQSMIIKKIIDNQLQHKQKNRKPVTVIWDSLAAITTQEILEAETGARMYPRLAMILSTRFPQIIDLLDDANVCLLILNQLREKPNVMFGDAKYTPGGNAMKFYASLRLFITRNSKIIVNKGKPNETVIGYNTTIETKKNKISAPARKAKLDLYFNRGISDISGALNILMQTGIINRPSKVTQELILSSGETVPFKLGEWPNLFKKYYDYIKLKTQEGLILDMTNPDLIENREEQEKEQNVMSETNNNNNDENEFEKE